MIGVTEYSDLDRLSEYRACWRDLLNQTSDASFIASWDWLETYWQHHGEGQQLRVLVVTVAARPIGLVPLVVKTVPSRCGPLKVLTWPVDGWSPTFGPIGPHPAATLLIALKHLRRRRADWDLMDFRYTDERNRRRLRNLLRATGFSAMERPWQRYALIEPQSEPQARCIRESFHAARESLDASLKGFRLLHYRPSDGWTNGQHSLRWDPLEMVLALPDVAAADQPLPGGYGPVLLRDLHAKAAAAGAAEIGLLLEGERPLAGAFHLRQGSRVDCLLWAEAPRIKGQGLQMLLGKMLLTAGFDGVSSWYVPPRYVSAVPREWCTPRSTYRHTEFRSRHPLVQLLRWHHKLRGWWNPARPSGLEVSDRQAEAAVVVPLRSAEPSAAQTDRPFLRVVG